MWSRIALLLQLTGATLAVTRCTWVTGFVKCAKDPRRSADVQLDLFDKDSVLPLNVFDKDDLMGRTFSREDGYFSLDGCGSDFNWLWIMNNPDPFIVIKHRCNGYRQTLQLPVFYKFAPTSHDVGTISLDDDD